MRSGTIKFEDLVCMSKPEDVFEEVCRIVLLIFPEFDFSTLRAVCNDVVRLFRGEYPGYRKCNIHYHDLKHTTDCLMAMARLIHGASLNGAHVHKEDVALGLIAGLMHDTGYIQLQGDSEGTGAKYTVSHVRRSIEFMERYLSLNGFSARDLEVCCNCVQCTGLEVKVERVHFQTAEHELMGKVLGTADLLGQMADRTYLERLPFLYAEFAEGGVPGFESEFDLLAKTPGFWAFTQQRLENELGGVDRYMKSHFEARWGLDRDLYREAIERNIDYVKCIIENHPNDYHKYLRRGGLTRLRGECRG